MDIAAVDEYETYVVVIACEPVAAFRAKRRENATPDTEIMQCLGAAYREGATTPLWDGTAGISCREADEDEGTMWLAGLTSALCGTWMFPSGCEMEVERNNFVFFLIPVDFEIFTAESCDPIKQRAATDA